MTRKEDGKIPAHPAQRGRAGAKGSAGRRLKTAREAIAEAAETIGGARRLAEWTKEDPANERAFWTTIYPKLLPLQVAGTDDPDGNPTAIRINIVDPRR